MILNRIRALVVAALASYAPLANAGPIAEECLIVEQLFAGNEISTLASTELADPYWTALQQFRLAAAYIPAKERKAARTAVREGLAIIQTLIEENPEDANIWVLGAMLDGQYLLLQPWRFVWNGRRGLKRVAEAERLDPNNPRIALVRGTAKFILPRILGGSAKEAESVFSDALSEPRGADTTFAATQLCANGEWGQVDLMNWLARAQGKLGKPELAQQTFQQALAYSPGNYWVEIAIKGEGYEWVEDE